MSDAEPEVQIPTSPLDVPDIEPNPAVTRRWGRYPKSYGTKETLAAKQAYVDYVSLGPSRSVKSLADLYQSLPPEEADKAPTQSYATIRLWSEKWQWDKRVEKILDKELKDIEKRDKERRAAVLEEGYALMIERVRGLKELAADIQETLLDGVEFTDEMGQKKRLPVSIRDRAALIGQLRGVLDDIAKEQGQRKPLPVEVTGDKGPVINIVSNIPDAEWMTE